MSVRRIDPGVYGGCHVALSFASQKISIFYEARESISLIDTCMHSIYTLIQFDGSVAFAHFVCCPPRNWQ